MWNFFKIKWIERHEQRHQHDKDALFKKCPCSRMIEMFAYQTDFHKMFNHKQSFLDPSQPLIDIQSQDALLRRLLIRQNLQEYVLSQVKAPISFKKIKVFFVKLALSQRLNRGFGGSQPSQPSTGTGSQPASQPTLVQRSYDNRPSVYNRRISSEQAQLPDGRLCTRVPARRWSKV